MISIFDAPWTEVGLEHVRSFLDEAGEEGLTWDAKSDGVLSGRGRPLNGGSIAKAACAFANQLGGYIIVGAERKTRTSPWELPGVAVPGDEPELWLSKAVGQLRPVPRHDIKVWPAANNDRRHVAVVQVEPLTRTPCMTRDGRVYERVTSESKPVDDPARLHDLLEQGERACSRACDNVTRSLSLFREHAATSLRWAGVSFGVGMAATSYESDIGRKLFTSEFVRFFENRFRERLFDQPCEAMHHGPDRQITQLAIRLTAEGPNFHWWTAQAQWNGDVVIHAMLKDQATATLGVFPAMIEPAWSLAAELVEALGGYGEAYTQMIIDPHLREQPGQRPTLFSRLERRNEFERWSDVAPPDDYDLDSIRRELDRAAGSWVLDDPPPSSPHDPRRA